ncbi:SDR family oxidoreductase [Burkholderia thailandensis]|uniref:SDR family NAD(P)-dependent oxidoreductase n=1 Tax=Burkholderia thailandensis TaxID=57975 RepID=UPI0003EC88BD|nr:SDR family oxidoreductase [Burkholderia thailandensis]AHI66901.1 short chain dehydrogenase family protein [Burkholderia thailandensis H0587]AVR27918.1 SDR family NAD(P)-dependent oxidoreductase [Burkholderia thailandensis]MCS3393120.1 SDR family oxidoreductase [Burkholderia thailandensis]MCS6429041.1 SDR family oxidoreductase [Burkholderia thailandensis]MCS6454524.1 SDR family oxidoreductase [Burkholderia thailandensis]
MAQRTAVVTGASQGIGAAIARRLRCEGYSVIEMQRTSADVTADLTDWRGMPEKWAKVVACSPDGVDLLVLNAGVTRDGEFVAIGPDEISHCFGLNVFSALLLAREALRHWRATKRAAHIVIIGSQAALPGARHADVLYAASKGALHAAVGPLARECGPLVRVNCIAPGDVATETELALLGRGRSDEEARAAWGEVASRSAIGRWVRPEEVADAVMFLERCAAMTGATVNVSGGCSIH